jgi:hypothetical protein
VFIEEDMMKQNLSRIPQPQQQAVQQQCIQMQEMLDAATAVRVEIVLETLSQLCSRLLKEPATKLR